MVLSWRLRRQWRTPCDGLGQQRGLEPKEGALPAHFWSRRPQDGAGIEHAGRLGAGRDAPIHSEQSFLRRRTTPQARGERRAWISLASCVSRAEPAPGADQAQRGSESKRAEREIRLPARREIGRAHV